MSLRTTLFLDLCLQLHRPAFVTRCHRRNGRQSSDAVCTCKRFAFVVAAVKTSTTTLFTVQVRGCVHRGQGAFGALAAFDDGTKIEKLPEVVYVRLEALQGFQVRAWRLARSFRHSKAMQSLHALLRIARSLLVLPVQPCAWGCDVALECQLNYLCPAVWA